MAKERTSRKSSATKSTLGQEYEMLCREMAERAKYDLHFFCVVVQGCDVMTPRNGFHGRLCGFMQRDDIKRRYVEIFRGSLKTTICDVGAGCQAVARDPNTRILVVSATQPLTKSIVRQSRHIVEGKVWKDLFPDLRPYKGLWGDKEALIARPGIGKQAIREPTWKAGSIDTGLTGGHYTRIHWDDIVTAENSETRVMAEKVIARFLDYRPLLDELDTPEVACNTPYKDYDWTSWLKKTPEGQELGFAEFRLPVVDETGAPAWADEFPPERMQELRKVNLERWYSQYLLDPVPPDGQRFKQSMFQYWWHPFEAQGREVPPDGLVLNPDKLTKYMGVDPATGVGGDESAIVVVGVDDYRRLFVVDVVHGQFSEAELIDLIFAMNRLHQPDRIGLETAGGFAGLMVTLASVMEMRGEYLAIEKMPLGNTQKEQRIAHALAPWYQMKKVYHPVNQCGGALEEQLLRFPKSRFDDIMDAYRHAVVLAQTYGHYGEVEEEKREASVLSVFGDQPVLGYTMEQMLAMVPEQHPEVVLREVLLGEKVF